MKKIIGILALAILFIGVPAIAAPGPHGGGHPGGMRGPAMGGGRPPMHAGVHMNRPMPGRPPMGGRPPMHHVGVRPLPPPPPMHRPIIRPYPYYYSSVYYPRVYYTNTYTYYPYSNYIYDGVEPVAPTASTVVIRDDYAGINTAANVINAAANVAATIRYFTW